MPIERGPSLIAVAIAVLGLAAAAAALATLAAFLREWRRERRFRELARQLGLAFVRGDRTIASQYGWLPSLRGRTAAAYNALVGTYSGREVCLLDYPSAIGLAGLTARSLPYPFTYLAMKHEGSFPELLVQPRKARWWDPDVKLDRLEIHLDPLEFTSAFRVFSSDRKFAYDICHPRMMEYLLAHRDMSLEIQGQHAALSFNRRLKVHEIPARLQQLAEVRKLVPEYLFEARVEETR